jgi:tetratricopeptide (TPR) repeat protein
MIKNESKIIKRAINSTLKVADAICIEDTGSTDNTLEIINEHFKTLTIPTKLTEYPWTNFGKSRSHSFRSAYKFCIELGWNPATTYALAIDADMNLVLGPEFDKKNLKLSGYQITQKNFALKYINMRFMRLSDDWKCIGATHEYWATPEGQQTEILKENIIHIDDKDDGGCKADKFTRDRDLLLEELKEQPSNPRTHFYLGQTYKCLNEYDEAIKYYKKRIQLGGWYEEVWFSHYMIAHLYLAKNIPEKAELWVQRAQAYNNYRAEALYILVKHFRMKPDQQWKAFHYLRQAMRIKKPEVALFLDSNVYDYHLDFEATILLYYVNTDKKVGNEATIRYLMKKNPHHVDNVFSNMEFYTIILPAHYKRIPLALPEYDTFKASSVSVIPYNDKYMMNIRYVNYETSRQGKYTPRDPEGQVRTRNAYTFYEEPFSPSNLLKLTFIKDETPEDLTLHETRIHGFEDVRLFNHNNTLYFTASSCEFAPQYRVILGKYDLSENKFTNNCVLQPLTHTTCEKNWLVITHKPEIEFIYNWYPLTIGKINSENVFTPQIVHQTPFYFKNLRGSANPVLYKDRLYVLLHAVKYTQPRKYMHHIVTLDPETYKPLQISLAFAFDEIGIEYCLTMMIKNDMVEFVYSHFDSNPKHLQIPLTEFSMIQIE